MKPSPIQMTTLSSPKRPWLLCNLRIPPFYSLEINFHLIKFQYSQSVFFSAGFFHTIYF